MLVFSRKRGEAVAVGDQDGHGQLLKVTVLEIRQTQVKLGFEAPHDIPVHRWEVWQRIVGQNGDVSKSAASPTKSQDRSEDDGRASPPLAIGLRAPLG